MPAPLVQAGTVNAITTGTNQPTLAGVTSGNTLISWIAADTTSNTATFSAPTDSAGQTWTLASSTIANFGSGAGVSVAFAYLLNANAGTHTLTWTSIASQAGSEGQVVEFNEITAFDKAATAATVIGAATLATNSISQAQANEVLFAMCSTPGNANPEFNTSNSTPPTGWTGQLGLENDAVNFSAAECAYFLANSLGSTTATYNWTTSGNAAALLIGFKYTPAAGTYLPPPPLASISRRDSYWNNRDYQTRPPNVLPAGVSPQIPPGLPQLQPWRRDPYWNNRDYWVRPPNTLPSGVSPQIPLGVLIPREQRTVWWPREYWTQPPNVLAQGLSPQIPPVPSQDQPWRRDPYWNPREYWVRPPNVLPAGVTLGQPGFVPNQDAAYRRDPYWNPREFQIIAPPVLPQGLAPQIPPPSPSQIDRRDWTAAQYQQLRSLLVPSAPTQVPPQPTTQIDRRDWDVSRYYTISPPVLPSGAAPQIPFPGPDQSSAHWRFYWGMWQQFRNSVSTPGFIPPVVTGLHEIGPGFVFLRFGGRVGGN